MLELRPNCKMCDKDLPPDATEARICSYECALCRPTKLNERSIPHAQNCPCHRGCHRHRARHCR
nr:DUF1272 domain-containing protein [Sulfitobacter marinus]